MTQIKKHLDAAARQRAYRERVSQRYLELNVYNPPPALDPAQAQAPTGKWNKLLQEAYENIAVVVTERQTYAAARSEKWQDSDRATDFEAITDELSELLETLHEHIPKWPESARQLRQANLAIESPFN